MSDALARERRTERWRAQRLGLFNKIIIKYSILFEQATLQVFEQKDSAEQKILEHIQRTNKERAMSRDLNFALMHCAGAVLRN